MSNKFFSLIFSLIILMNLLLNAFEVDAISIFPKPQQITPKNFKVLVRNYWAIIVDMSDTDEISLAKYLEEKLIEDYNIFLPLVDINSTTKFDGIILGNFEKSRGLKNLCLKYDIEVDSNLNKEGYILDVLNENVFVIGRDHAGIFYGMQSLFQLFNKNVEGTLTISAVKIKDYPKLKIRGVHINAANPEKFKNQIDYMSKLKMNTTIIENWVYFNLDKDNNGEKWKELFEYARERFIEPIPQLTSFSYAGPILSKDPYAAEGIFVEDEHFKFVNNEATSINPTKHILVNVIISEDSNIVVKNLGRTQIYEENKDYKIIKGAISYPFSLDNRQTKIIRIPGGDIKDGEEVLVSYDYVEKKTTSWATTWAAPYCPSSDRTYKIMFNALENVIYMLNPKYICIGHDEIFGLNRDLRCKKRNLSNAELLADEIIRLNDYIKTIDSNIRLLMWDDMVNPWHNGGNENIQVEFGGVPGKTSEAIDLIPDDIILLSWWYGSSDWLNKMKNSPIFFESKGFEYLVAGYKDKGNIKAWAEQIKNKEKCLGIITTTWEGWEKNIEGIRYIAEMGW